MALSRTRFPRGTLSPMLDAIARAPLWEHGLDYGHGTGHGVGYFLNVHEGPQSISQALPEPHMAMEPGMITSIEPGVYRPGQWGVRIENLVLNVPVDTPEDGAFGEFLDVRDADPVPDRHALHRARRCCAPTSATGSTATTPRCASGCAAGERRRTRVADRTHATAATAADAMNTARPAPSVSTSVAPRSKRSCSMPAGTSAGASGWRRRAATTTLRCRRSSAS